MKRRLVKESRAESDMSAHLEYYLERELFDVAYRFIDSLGDFFEAVLEHPEIAPLYETANEELRSLALRIWPLGHGFPHVLFYYLNRDEIRVFRVLHGAMDRESI